MTVYWQPIHDALYKARRKSQSENKRIKWEYQCGKCKKWWTRKEVEVNHIEEAGRLKCAEDLPGFVTRLFAESGYEVLCRPCHKKITEENRKLKNKM